MSSLHTSNTTEPWKDLQTAIISEGKRQKPRRVYMHSDQSAPCPRSIFTSQSTWQKHQTQHHLPSFASATSVLPSLRRFGVPQYRRFYDIFLVNPQKLTAQSVTTETAYILLAALQQQVSGTSQPVVLKLFYTTKDT